MGDACFYVVCCDVGAWFAIVRVHVGKWSFLFIFAFFHTFIAFSCYLLIVKSVCAVLFLATFCRCLCLCLLVWRFVPDVDELLVFFGGAVFVGFFFVSVAFAKLHLLGRLAQKGDAHACVYFLINIQAVMTAGL